MIEQICHTVWLEAVTNLEWLIEYADDSSTLHVLPYDQGLLGSFQGVSYGQVCQYHDHHYFYLDFFIRPIETTI